MDAPLDHAVAPRHHRAHAWVDTKYLAGYPGSYVVMARRKGHDWYLAGIAGDGKKVTIAVFGLNGVLIKRETVESRFLNQHRDLKLSDGVYIVRFAPGR